MAGQLAAALIGFVVLVRTLSSNAEDEGSMCKQQRCGDVNVNFPFAVAGCRAFSPFFQLRCDESSNFKPVINATTNVAATGNATVVTLEVTHITSNTLVVNVTSLVVHLYDDSSGHCRSDGTNVSIGGLDGPVGQRYISLPVFPGPFIISDANQFGAFGCTYGVFVTAAVSPQTHLGDNSYGADYVNVTGSANVSDVAVGGCVVPCLASGKMPLNSDCDNRVCCLTQLAPSSFSRFAQILLTRSPPPFAPPNSVACDAGATYSTFFHNNYTDFYRGSFGLELKWALPSNLSIETVIESPDYACSVDSDRPIFVPGVPGYLCSCKPGFRGDGYLKGTLCADIDECAEGIDDCVAGSTCHNTAGNYTCSCNSRFQGGNGRKSGSGCQLLQSLTVGLPVSGVLLGVVVFLSSLMWVAIWWKRRTKRMYFLQNGGLQIEAILGSRPRRDTQIFSSEELIAATDNYAEHMKLGAGGFGTVFKGVLEDGTMVAIKKANNMMSEGGTEQFLNEMAILMHINHRNIVRLLGCCLETKVPLLVYEYVSHGTLAENLEGKSGWSMGWHQRLKVAWQTAEALAYLHAAASPPILHRDVKSANVLVDENLDAKVADFGLSRLVAEGTDRVSTAVRGTIGYLDPEYFQTLYLSTKSDVYSLGVMLAELITGLKAVDNHERDQDFANLALLFLHHMEQGTLRDIIDPRLVQPRSGRPLISDDDGVTMGSVSDVATLTQQCLALSSSQRPTMSQVAHQLHDILQSVPSESADSRDGDEDNTLAAFRRRMPSWQPQSRSGMAPNWSHGKWYSRLYVSLTHW